MWIYGVWVSDGRCVVLQRNEQFRTVEGHFYKWTTDARCSLDDRTYPWLNTFVQDHSVRSFEIQSRPFFIRRCVSDFCAATSDVQGNGFVPYWPVFGWAVHVSLLENPIFTVEHVKGVWFYSISELHLSVLWACGILEFQCPSVLNDARCSHWCCLSLVQWLFVDLACDWSQNCWPFLLYITRGRTFWRTLTSSVQTGAETWS